MLHHLGTLCFRPFRHKTGGVHHRRCRPRIRLHAGYKHVGPLRRRNRGDMARGQSFAYTRGCETDCHGNRPHRRLYRHTPRRWQLPLGCRKTGRLYRTAEVHRGFRHPFPHTASPHGHGVLQRNALRHLPRRRGFGYRHGGLPERCAEKRFSPTSRREKSARSPSPTFPRGCMSSGWKTDMAHRR